MHDYGGYPFIYDLSRALSEAGNSVIHIYSSASGSPSGNFTETSTLKVIDLGANLPKVNKNSFFQRYKQENFYGSLIAGKIIELKPDLVISSNTPLEAQKKIASICTRNSIPFIHWLQDILSIAAKNVITKKNRFLGLTVGMYFRNIEKKCLEAADHVVVISLDFLEIIKEWGVSSHKISVIENWSNVTEISAIDKKNTFSEKFGIVNTFNIIYSGTLGMKQNPELLIEMAEIYKSSRDVRIVVIATGSGVPYLRSRAETLGLKNILILPLQPFELLPEVLGSGDLLVAMLESDASVYCVPSKILTYYCAGRPSLLIMSKKNLAARTTIENELGFVVEPGDTEELRSVTNRAMKDPEKLKLLGMKARQYAEEHFPIERIAGQFLPVIKKLKK